MTLLKIALGIIASATLAYGGHIAGLSLLVNIDKYKRNLGMQYASEYLASTPITINRRGKQAKGSQITRDQYASTMLLLSSDLDMCNATLTDIRNALDLDGRQSARTHDQIVHALSDQGQDVR